MFHKEKLIITDLKIRYQIENDDIQNHLATITSTETKKYMPPYQTHRQKDKQDKETTRKQQVWEQESQNRHILKRTDN